MNENKIKAVYIGWAFIHLVFLTIGLNGKGHDSLGYSSKAYRYFLPFGEGDYSIYRNILGAYDLSEFLVYAGTPAVVYFIYKLLNK